MILQSCAPTSPIGDASVFARFCIKIGPDAGVTFSAGFYHSLPTNFRLRAMQDCNVLWALQNNAFSPWLIGQVTKLVKQSPHTHLLEHCISNLEPHFLLGYANMKTASTEILGRNIASPKTHLSAGERRIFIRRSCHNPYGVLLGNGFKKSLSRSRVVRSV